MSSRKILIVLVILAVLAAILTPEATDEGGGLSSYSTAPLGSSISYELAQRMGWRVLRRDTPADSVAGLPTVQVVIGPEQALGRHEVHHLLENVRRGGGLVFSLESNDEIADSLGVVLRQRGRLLTMAEQSCSVARRQPTGLAALPPTMYEIAWRRPAPGPVRSLSLGTAVGPGMKGELAPVAVGFPLGKGKVAVIGSDAVFANETVRTCQWGADLLVARAWEFMRVGTEGQPLVFDEFHHGHGVHEGSIGAITTYLSHTASGHFFATLLAAGLLLLFALAERPIIPREPERIMRRSPLEHADALGRAYSDVGATRTATARLVSGLRRRTTRAVAADRKVDDRGFLEVVARRYPVVAKHVTILQRGLNEQITPREFAQSADAIEEIERIVATPPSPVKA
ncbi:MAG TPA: DUF4350 domain-containing protein [Gemmatimonadaceae bacterium]|jgi:hypothetical protein